MGGKDCRYLWQYLLYIKGGSTCLPLIDMENDFLITWDIGAIETLDDLSCSVREHQTVVVIAISMKESTLKSSHS